MSQRATFIAVAVGGVLAELLFLAGIRYTLFLRIQNSSETLLDAKNALTVLDKRARLLKDLETLVAAERAGLERIDSAFLKENDIVPFLKTLEETASLSGVSISITGASPGTGADARTELLFTLTGSLDNIVRMVTLLEHLPFQGDITRLTLQAFGSVQPRADIAMSVLTEPIPEP